ncbi:hypothetical protein MXB_1124 [Myxobolus squamalis]|nr:hypothetical protein MXB_1124 [Myxobolus squamalis]
MRKYIFHPKTKIKYYIIGGESFPPPTWLKQCIDYHGLSFKLPSFVNLYGTTEMSPWSSYYILSDIFLSEYIEGRAMIPIIGKLFPETYYRTEPHHSDVFSLHLGTDSRICFVDGDSSMLTHLPRADSNDRHFIPTGDLVQLKDSSVFYFSRANNCIKRGGKMINLDFLTNEVTFRRRAGQI